VPLNSFSEFNKAEGGDIWFALDESRPLACFWTNWTSVRKVKKAETTNDLFAFLITEPNARSGTTPSFNGEKLEHFNRKPSAISAGPLLAYALLFRSLFNRQRHFRDRHQRTRHLVQQLICVFFFRQRFGKHGDDCGVAELLR
jgi:hypothetical protein